jgi:hypothetical protein
VSGGFDRFIAIDWSGAKPAKGIAVAEAGAGSAPPSLVRPPAGARSWSRRATLDWLLGRLDGSERLLIGMDFAFSLGCDRRGRFIAGDAGTAFDLWGLVDAAGAAEEDFFGGAFATAGRHRHRFWHRGARPAGFDPCRRLTETACTQGSPESPYKLIGAKQVGKGALAGMRVLKALRERGRGRVGVWPFEPVGDGSAVVEIYPRLFLRRCGWGNGKVRDRAGVNWCLARLGSRPLRPAPEPLSDHDTDALVSAAGLRTLAAAPRAWSPPLPERARRQEGWIFGVGL